MKEKLEKLNERRLELLEKKYTFGLSKKEEKELQKVTKQVTIIINKLFPLPFEELEEIEKRLDSSEKELEKLLKKYDLECPCE